MNIITSWDDACSSDTRLADLLNKYDIKGIFFWQNNLTNPFNLKRCKKFLTLEECKNISKKFEIGSHTVNHNYLTDVSIHQAENEIVNSKKIWENKLGKKINWFCYPRGRNNKKIVDIVSKHYLKARLTELNSDDKIENNHLIKPNLHVGVIRKDYLDKKWYNYGCEIFIKMKKLNCKTFHLFGHSWELDEFNEWNNLEQYFKFLKDNK